MGIKSEQNFYSMFGSAVDKYVENVIERSDFRTYPIVKSYWKFFKQNAVNNVLQFEVGEKIMSMTREDWVKSTKMIFVVGNSVLSLIKEKFSNIKKIECQHKLYEQIKGSALKFKGYIDIIIHLNNGKKIVIDLKTVTNPYSWIKFADTTKLYQVILYKNFLAQEFKINNDDIDCHYLLATRDNNKSELYSITSGNKKIDNANIWLTKNIKSLNKGTKMKNRAACKFCPFKERKDLCS